MPSVLLIGITNIGGSKPGAEHVCLKAIDYRKRGMTRKFVGKEDLFNTKGQRVKGSKVGRNFFAPLNLCPFVLKLLADPQKFSSRRKRGRYVSRKV
jgi:hypothetical protein